MLGISTELYTLLGVHSREKDRKEISNNQLRVSIAFSVNVAEATWAKKADF
jgi:hypothetical protein